MVTVEDVVDDQVVGRIVAQVGIGRDGHPPELSRHAAIVAPKRSIPVRSAAVIGLAELASDLAETPQKREAMKRDTRRLVSGHRHLTSSLGQSAYRSIMKTIG